MIMLIIITLQIYYLRIKDLFEKINLKKRNYNQSHISLSQRNIFHSGGHAHE